MECRVATTFDWQWGPSTLQRLGKAQALRVYIYIIYNYIYIIYHKWLHFWFRLGLAFFCGSKKEVTGMAFPRAMVCMFSLMLCFYIPTGICQCVIYVHRSENHCAGTGLPEAGVSSFKQLCKTKETGGKKTERNWHITNSECWLDWAQSWQAASPSGYICGSVGHLIGFEMIQHFQGCSADECSAFQTCCKSLRAVLNSFDSFSVAEAFG